MVIKSEEHLRKILQRGGRLSFSKAKRRWLIYSETLSGLQTTYVDRRLDPLCQRLTAEPPSTPDDVLISKVVEERCVPEKTVEAERISRLKYAERVTTLLGRYAQHVFSDTVKIQDDDWKGTDKQQAQRIAERFINQMKKEHNQFVAYEKLKAGDPETMEELKRIQEAADKAFRFYGDREALMGWFWWHGWISSMELNRLTLVCLLEKLGYTEKKADQFMSTAYNDTRTLLEDENVQQRHRERIDQALRLVEEEEKLKNPMTWR